MKLVYKISFACGIICLVNVRADRGGTSDNLIYKHASAFAGINLVADSDYM